MWGERDPEEGRIELEWMSVTRRNSTPEQREHGERPADLVSYKRVTEGGEASYRD